jgi:hypothetical protein
MQTKCHVRDNITFSLLKDFLFCPGQCHAALGGLTRHADLPVEGPDVISGGGSRAGRGRDP